MGREGRTQEKILKTIAWVCLALLIVSMLAIAYSGKMFVLPYNAVLYICVFFILAVIGFWIYMAIKGVDNVFVGVEWDYREESDEDD